MNLKEKIQKVKPAIGLIVVHDNETNKFNIRGTGFLISQKGQLITNWHVCGSVPADEIQNLMIMLPEKTDNKGVTNYKSHKVSVVEKDKENDIALLQIANDQGLKFDYISDIEYADGVYKEGEEAVFLGYPLAAELIQMQFGITMTVNRCIVSCSKRRGSDGSFHFFLIDTHANRGSSGSPIFSLETGSVIGIVSGNIGQNIMMNEKPIQIPANIAICRPSMYIKDLLEK